MKAGLPGCVRSALLILVAAWLATGCNSRESRPQPLDLFDEELAQQECDAWLTARSNLEEGAWSGDLENCVAGDMEGDWRQRSLGLLNLYRSMAGLAAVEGDSALHLAAQECSLMMAAGKQLSHDPDEDWACWSASGAGTAGRSNLSTMPTLHSIDNYMVDYGNGETLGHRRWLLSNELGPVGIGSTSSASCLQVLGGLGEGGPEWTVWPPPGSFPYSARGHSDAIDTLGWSIQSDSMSLNGLGVTVLEDGLEVAVETVALAGDYGNADALAIRPEGWTSRAGSVYEVSAQGVFVDINWTFQIADCGDELGPVSFHSP